MDLKEDLIGGTKKKSLPDKITLDEFEKLALEHAQENINDDAYLWMKTKQSDDYNFDNYLDVNFKFVGDTTHVIVRDKKIHPEYRLSFIVIATDERSYTLWGKNKNPPYELIIKRNLKGSEIIMSGEVTSSNPGLLDIEIRKIIDKL